MLCVDEQMILFKGTLSLKQYLPNKPHKYGYKVFVLCGITGIIPDFKIYTEKIDPTANGLDLGASSNVVPKLESKITGSMNYLIYYDRVSQPVGHKRFCGGPESYSKNWLLGSKNSYFG